MKMSLGVLGYFGNGLNAVLFTCSSAQVLTFKDVQVNRSARYAQHDVVGALPINEYVGKSLSTVSFTITLSQDHNAVPMLYFDVLKNILESGQAQKLILGPDYMGEFVLESYDENRKHFTGIGICTFAEVTLHLREVGGFNLLNEIVNKVKEVIS